MTREEAWRRTKGYLYDALSGEEADEIIKTLELSRDMEEIEEVINCDADAETKCKMISNILTAKPHYFEKQESINKTVQKAYEDRKKDGYVQAKVGQESKTGKWILLDECANSGYYCSKCQKKLVKEGWSKTVKKIKYCPNCGAKMEVEQNG
jgi:hypothetical protein